MSAWVFLAPTAIVTDVNLLGIESSLGGPTMSVSLRATTTGLLLYIKGAGGYERHAEGAPRPPVPIEKWFEVGLV